MKFSDIPLFTRSGSYMVHVSLDYLPSHYARMVGEYGLDVSPDFQRAHVWTTDQKIHFMEYMLRGGTSGLDIYCNSPTWNKVHLGIDEPNNCFVLVDGKQRLDAALGFLNNEFPAFGALFREYEDKPRIMQSHFRWHVNDLATYEEVLQWYLDLNTGGTVHTPMELDKVRALLQAKVPYVRPSGAEILSNGNMDRKLIQDELAEMRRERERRAESAAAAEAERAAKASKKGRRKK